MFDLFRNFSLAFFSLIESKILAQASRQVATEEPKKIFLKRLGAVIYVSCFSLHFFRALAASCMLHNRTKHGQGFSIC